MGVGVGQEAFADEEEEQVQSPRGLPAAVRPCWWVRYRRGCCCCKVTSVVSDSVRPQRRQPTRLCRPWDPPGKNTGVGCHFLLQCMKVKSEREVAQSCPTLSNPMDWPSRLLHPWDFPGKSTGVGCHCGGSAKSEGQVQGRMCKALGVLMEAGLCLKCNRP